MRPDRLLLQDMLEAVEEVLDTTPSLGPIAAHDMHGLCNWGDNPLA